MATSFVRDSIECLVVTLTDRDQENLSSNTVSLAVEIPGSGTAPTWLAATYVSGNTWRTTSAITWSAANYPLNAYAVWAKVVDSPETPWTSCGQVGISER